MLVQPNFYFCEFFLAVPIFAGRDTAEKVSTEQMFLCEMVVLQDTYLYRRDAGWLAAFALLERKLATIEQLMWPKPTTRLGLLPALRQHGRARKSLVERMVPQYQLRRESRLRVLEGHFPPSMIGECRCC